MSLNKTLTGNIYNHLGEMFQGSEVHYQGYFIRNNNLSSVSQGNTIRVSEYGQYNINLGDGDWLTNDGNAQVGDSVLLAFGIGDNRESLDLTEGCFIVHTLDSRDVYVQNVELNTPNNPSCSFNFTKNEQTVEIFNVGSHNRYQGEFDGITHYQRRFGISEEIFPVNKFHEDVYSVYGDDGNVSISSYLDNSLSHTYDSPGEYNVTITLHNVKDLTCSQEFSYVITGSPPNVDFDADKGFPQPNGVTGYGELVTFFNQSTDFLQDGYFDGETDGKDIKIGASFEENTSYRYDREGNFPVTLTCNGFDGFQGKEESITKYVQQLVGEAPTPDFDASDWSPLPDGDSGYGEKVSFTNTTTGHRDGYYYDGIFDNVILQDNVSKSYPISNRGDSSGTHSVKLICYWSDGFQGDVIEVEKEHFQDVGKVNNGLDWTKPVYQDVEVTFSPNISGDISYIDNVRYEMDMGTSFYNNLTYDQSFTHTYTDSYERHVQQCIRYFDGFEDREKCKIFLIKMSPICRFFTDSDECGIMFIDNSIAGTPPITNYRWEIRQGPTVMATTEGRTNGRMSYSGPRTGGYVVILTVTDSAGEICHTHQEFDINQCPHETRPEPVPQYGVGATMIEHRFPKINAELIEEPEEDIFILVKKVEQD